MLLALSSLLWPSYHNALMTPQSASYPRNSLRLQRSPRTWRVKFELSSSSHRHLRKRHSRIWRNRSGLYCRATAWRMIVLEACTLRSRRTTSKPGHFGPNFKASAKRRNDAVHKGVRINLADAQLSCRVAEQLITHLDQVAVRALSDCSVT